jgi:hypothetical protein
MPFGFIQQRNLCFSHMNASRRGGHCCNKLLERLDDTTVVIWAIVLLQRCRMHVLCATGYIFICKALRMRPMQMQCTQSEGTGLLTSTTPPSSFTALKFTQYSFFYRKSQFVRGESSGQHVRYPLPQLLYACRQMTYREKQEGMHAWTHSRGPRLFNAFAIKQTYVRTHPCA